MKHFNEFGTYLSEDSQKRLTSNPLRILDSKHPDDKKIVEMAPGIDAYLSDEARSFYDEVKSGLKAAGVDWVPAPKLVRGLDYYRHTAFEFIPDEGSEAAGKLGSQSTILGGGRYDGLMESLGGAPTPAVGWAAGIERLAMLVGARREARNNVAVVSESEATDKLAWMIAFKLRNRNVGTSVWADGGLRKRFDKAVKENPQVILVLDDKSVGEWTAAVVRVRSLVADQVIPEDLSASIVDSFDALSLWAGSKPSIEHGRELELRFDL